MKKTFTQLGKTLLFLTIALFSWQSSMCQFTPGEGGSLPDFTPITGVTGKIGGLYVRSTERENNYFYTGTRTIVELRFPAPLEFGATSYTLQFSSDNGATWQNYQYGGDLTTTGNNFSLTFDAAYKLRLLVNGGTKDGYTSNEVLLTLSAIDTRFAGWSLDESMFLTGIITPYIGRGIQASFIVKKLSDDSAINGFLSYQWYRVNPLTYETTAISGATNLTYTTTVADAGYLLLIRATGDEINVGGYAQILVSSRNIVPNKAFISNLSNSGFTLNLIKTVSNFTASDLSIYDKDANPVLISSLTQGANAAIYNISSTLDIAKGPFFLQNNSIFWHLVSSLFGDQMMMEGVSFNLTTGMNDIHENTLNIYPIPAINAVNFKASTKINQAIIMSINGAVLLQSNINSNEGTLNTSELSNGIYFLRLITSNGVLTRKIQISK